MIKEFVPVKAVKVGNSLVLDVLAAPFGNHQDLDSDGEFFSERTKFHLDKYNPPAVWLHGGVDGSDPEFIGQTVSHEVKSDGVWLRVVLDATKAKALEVWNAAQRGLAVASSGSVAHLVRKVGAEIINWPMAEISLWELRPGLPRQANKRAIAMPAFKSNGYNELVEYCESIDQSGENPGQGSSLGSDSSSHNLTDTDSNGDKVKMSETLSKEEIAALVAESVKATLQADKEAEEARLAEAQARKDAVKLALDEQSESFKAEADKIAKQHEDELAALRRLPMGDAPYQTKFANIARYDSADPLDLAFASGIMSAAKRKGLSDGPSQDMLKASAIRFLEEGNPEYNAAKTAIKASGMPVKADELNQSDLAGFGDEWVGQAYSTMLWDKVRLETPVASRLPTVEVPQGHESITIPVGSTSPTFYKVAQAADQDANPGGIAETFTSSRLVTANKTITPLKMGAAVNWSGELEEDSLVRWSTEVRRDLVSEFAEVLEHIIIDGDTQTSTANINDAGASTPAATDVFLLFDGFRKLALITNTANAVDAGGALSIDDFIDTAKLLGVAGINGFAKRQVAFIMDPNTMYATMKLTEVKNRDNVATPVIESGVVTQLFGHDLIVSANMHRADSDRLADATGEVDQDTPANNTKGALLAVRFDQWRLAYKRRMTIEVDREPLADANTIVIHSRVGMVNRDNEASAITYNITV